jgi:hypothetical protein
LNYKKETHAGYASFIDSIPAGEPVGAKEPPPSASPSNS